MHKIRESQCQEGIFCNHYLMFFSFPFMAKYSPLTTLVFCSPGKFGLTINLFNSFVSVNRSDEFPVPSGRISDP